MMTLNDYASLATIGILLANLFIIVLTLRK